MGKPTHHLSQQRQLAEGTEAWSAVDSVGKGTNGVSNGTDTASPSEAQQHINLDGAALTEEQKFDAQIHHVECRIQSELQSVGELLLQLGGDAGDVSGDLSQEQIDSAVSRIKVAADKVDSDVTVISATPDGADGKNGSTSASDSKVPAAKPAAILLRQRPGEGCRPLEVRVAVIGNVDSGKSTMVGVLTRSMLDDGRGSARSKVFKHNHEGETGRTSAIGQHNMCLGSEGNILNDAMFKNNTCHDYVSRSSKVVTMVDLAGHERYFKTTAYGLTGHLPDYACLLVGANAGVVGMCKEHLGVALALKVPAFFVITKVDICPEHILKQSLQQLMGVLKRPGVKKRPFVVNTVNDVVTCARAITSESLAPIFLTSAVTGQGLDLLRLFINLTPQRQRWAERRAEPVEFIIDETFGVPGVGTVVAGTVKRGVLNVQTPLVIGPSIADASFSTVAIKSIHYKRLPVSECVAGQTAAVALKKVKRDQVRKGMVLVHRDVKPAASWEFDAEIAILTHATTIQPRYQAVIHCEIIRQAARVVAMNKERLRSGDRARVRFRFIQHPEYITEGTRFVFREGRTKGIGMVVGTEGANTTMAIPDAAAANES